MSNYEKNENNLEELTDVSFIDDKGDGVLHDTASFHMNKNLEHPLLTKEREVELSKRIKEGCEKSFSEMFHSNLRLVVSIAKCYKPIPGKVEMSDLIAEGNIGLLDAIKKYDPGFDCRFSTYASNWIKMRITRTLTSESKTVRWPTHFFQLEANYRKLLLENEKKNIPPPSDEELMEKLEITPITLKGLKDVNRIELSSSLPTHDNEEGGGDLEGGLFDDRDNLGVEFTVNESISKTELRVAFAKSLKEREEFVLQLRFGLVCNPMTLDEVADILKLTKERVRQIEVVGLVKLKRYFEKTGVCSEDLFST